MADGTLQALRDGKLRQERSDVDREQPKSTAKRRDKGSRGGDGLPKGKGGDSKRSANKIPDDDDDESDGGFFE
jgi:hypothetical protein